MTLCEAKWCSHLEETTFDVDLQGGGGVSCDTGYQPKISLKLIFHNIGLDVRTLSDRTCYCVTALMDLGGFGTALHRNVKGTRVQRLLLQEYGKLRSADIIMDLPLRKHLSVHVDRHRSTHTYSTGDETEIDATMGEKCVEGTNFFEHK